jgi:hypothetical protein
MDILINLGGWNIFYLIRLLVLTLWYFTYPFSREATTRLEDARQQTTVYTAVHNKE